jgi:hypothetical protein
MKLKTLILAILVISTMFALACSPQEAIDSNDYSADDASADLDDTLTDSIDEEFASDEEYVEIGEMI